jgi:hypothetical protein
MENVSAPKQTTIFPEEFGASKTKKRKPRAFRDAPYWDNLATKYLASYSMPNWGVPATTELVLEWMMRIGVRESQLNEVLGCSAEELVRLNKKYPIRAFIGILLEIREMKTNTKPRVG